MGCKRTSLVAYLICGVGLLTNGAGSNINSFDPKSFKLLGKPSFEIVGKKAEFQFHYSGLLTRLKVKNCVKGTAKCHVEYIDALPAEKSKPLSEAHNFEGEILLVDPSAKTLTFSFWAYAGDKPLNPAPYTIDVDLPSQFSLRGRPTIRVVGKKAELHFRYSGPLTRINVTNCVKGTTTCLTETLLVVPDGGGDVHSFNGEVHLVDPDAKTLTFFFWGYVGDRLINHSPYAVDVDVHLADNRFLIILVLAAFIGVIVVAICIVLALFFCGVCPKRKRRQKYVVTESPVLVRDNVVGRTTISTHKDWYRVQEPIPGPLVRARRATYTQNAPPGVGLKTLLRDGNFYDVWKGSIIDRRNASRVVAIKVEKDNSDVFINYLIKQGQAITKLQNTAYAIGCLGTPQDHRFLLMELSAKGDLKQYLKARANRSSSNLSYPPSFAISFIDQIIEGVNAVHSLDPPCLFYCLCASHVLLSSDERCKLTGFAESDAVLLREEFEEKNNLPRPVQWLSPEAIRLQHTRQSDLWSFGILMWEIFTEGRDPFDEFNSEEARYLILNGQKLLKPIKCSDKMYDVMLRCWMYEPSNRPSLQEINDFFLKAQC